MNSNMDKKKTGRPPKKNYDQEKQLQKLLDTVDLVYESTGEIKATADELGLSTTKVKKLLITSGKLEYDETRQIQRMMAYGKALSEIIDETGLKKSAINSYLPYTKNIYKDDEVSANADRCELYRRRKSAVEGIRDIDTLWECIVLFQGYVFKTSCGLKFKYAIRGDEIIVDCVDSSKSITKFTVELAYKIVKRLMSDDGCVTDSEKLSIFEASYLYPIFVRFGIILEGQSL